MTIIASVRNCLDAFSRAWRTNARLALPAVVADAQCGEPRVFDAETDLKALQTTKRALRGNAELENRRASVAFEVVMHAATFQNEAASWRAAHEALSRLAEKRALADVEEGRWLLVAWRAAVHVRLGMGSFGEYVERLFGYSRRLTREKLRVAEALEGLPMLMRAFEAGELNGSAVRELTRVAVDETESEWLEVARGKTVRQLEGLVAGRGPGDRLDTPGNESARRHVLRFEVTGETLALFRQATVALRRKAGSSLSDDDVLLEMARQVLGGPGDEGRSSYQIAVTVCAECGRGWQDAGHETVALGAEVLEMACCDAQHLGRVDGVRVNDGLGHEEGAARDVARENDACAVHAERGVEHDGPSADDARTMRTSGSADGGAPNASGARAAHVGRTRKAVVRESSDPPGHAAPPAMADAASCAAARARSISPESIGATALARRASQSVPPAVRRAVLRRDQGRCRVPGCGNCAFLDVHHLALRSERGPHDAANLITMCGAHHRALHHGVLAAEGEGSAVRFRWADGSVYGGVANPTLLDTACKVFSALRHMGFREGEVRRALAEVRERCELEGASVQEWLRAALGRLVPARR